MKWILIGHRGVGKSSLLKRMETYFSDNAGLRFFDLDQEISRQYGKPVSQVFTEIGEEAFRISEQRIFHEIADHHSQFIFSVGAGFRINHLPAHCMVLWVRRKTDSLGRIFFNRPRLNRETTPLEEYFERYPLRQEYYHAHAHFQYLMPEGIEKSHEEEEKVLRHLFGLSTEDVKGILTLMPRHLNRETFSIIKNWRVDHFELRDDLLSVDEILDIVHQIPKEKLLLSFRQKVSHPQLIDLSKSVKWDWPVELGECAFGQPSILSCHGDLKDLPNKSLSHLKLSPVIENFEELEKYLNWQSEDSTSRSLLPRSSDGRWAWVRLWLKGRQAMNFFKMDEGSALDQPSLYEWVSQSDSIKNFAAILGHPILHSFTPQEQGPFFQSKQMPVLGIDLKEEEFQKAWPLLEKMGLKAAAVTSPLKKMAAGISQKKSTKVSEFYSANTLIKDEQWISENTDWEALVEISKDMKASSVAIWGGGGTLPLLQKLFPQAVSYSARTGQSRQESEKQRPELLIWAASPDAQPPEKDWQPRIVLDLNYREDSLAREYALEVHAQYIDGLKMFKVQAEKQREFWEQFLK